MYFDKKAAVSRFTPNQGDTDKEQYASVDGLGNIDINVQPASAELIAITDGAVGLTFEAFTSISGIKVGGRITISGSGGKFIVKGVREWFFAPIPHLEIILFKGDEENGDRIYK